MLEHTQLADTRPQRVVVMGAGGFVGGAIMRRLAEAGVKAIGLGRTDVDLLSEGAAPRLASILRPEDAFVGVSAIAPCKNADMLVQNMKLARSLTKALELSPVSHVINISSDAVYGDSSEPLSEASPLAPESLHGAMHLARELMFRSSVSAPLAILRPSLLYGAGDPHNGYGPNRFRRQANNGETIVLFGEGEEQRDHVYIEDVAQLVLRVLMRRSSGSLNVATGQVHSFRHIAEEIVRISGRSSQIQATARTGPMPHNGYRAFSVAACRSAFPDFCYTLLSDGLKLSDSH